MRKYIVKVLLFVLPIVIICMMMELLIRKIPNDYSYKSTYLANNSSKIDYLFLGSSHTYYGINPALFSKGSFNASHISQSIDYDYEILKKYESHWNNLRYIFIPIDYFTLYYRIETSSEPWRVKNYELYYEINKSNKIFDHSEVFHFKPLITVKRIYLYYLKNENAITCSKQGFGNQRRVEKNLYESGPKAAIRHTITDHKDYDKNVAVINKIVDFAATNDTKVVFYTSPSFHTYFENLEEHQLQKTLNTIEEIALKNENCSYYNYLSDNAFNKNDFMDAHHLNSNGAKKLTLKLKQLVDVSNNP